MINRRQNCLFEWSGERSFGLGSKLKTTNTALQNTFIKRETPINSEIERMGMRRGTPQSNDVEKGIASLKNFAASLIEFIDNPSVKVEELRDINGRVAEFFKLVNEAITLDLNAQDTTQLQFIVDSFHKTVTKKYQKIKGKTFMAEAGATMAKVKEQTASSAGIAKTAKEAESAWKRLFRQEDQSTTVQRESSMVSAEINEKLQEIANTYLAILPPKMLRGFVSGIKMLYSPNYDNSIGGRVGMLRDIFVENGRGEFGPSAATEDRVAALAELFSRKDIAEQISRIGQASKNMNERDMVTVGQGIALVANMALSKLYFPPKISASELKAEEMTWYADAIVRECGDSKPWDSAVAVAESGKVESVIIGALTMNEDIAKRFNNMTREYVSLAQDPLIATALFFGVKSYLSYNTMLTETAGKFVSLFIDALSDKDVQKKLADFYKNLDVQKDIAQNKFVEISDLAYEFLYLMCVLELFSRAFNRDKGDLYQQLPLGALDDERRMLENSAENVGYLKEVSGRKKFRAPHFTMVPARLMAGDGGRFNKDKYTIFLATGFFTPYTVLHEVYHAMFHDRKHVRKFVQKFWSTLISPKDFELGIVQSINEGFAELCEITKAIKDESRWAGEERNPEELLKEKMLSRVRTYLKSISGNENEASGIARDVYETAKTSKSADEFIDKLAAKIIPYGINGVPLVHESPQDPHEIGLVLAMFELIAQKYDDQAAIRRSLEKRPDEILDDVFKLMQSDKGRLIEAINSSM
jgi:hypothetical protein